MVSLSVPLVATGMLATGSNRLDVAHRALESASVEQGGANVTPAAVISRSIAAFGTQEAFTVALRKAALKQVDQDLVDENLLDKVGGQISPEAVKRSWKKS